MRNFDCRYPSTKLDLVHLSGIVDGVNHTFKKVSEIATIWSFWLTR